LLTVGVALPLSALLADKAWAFVDEEDITASERQRRELVKAIQERAAQAKSETEAAATEAAKTVEVQAEAVKSEVQEAAPKVEKVVKEAPKEVAAQVESVATEAKKAPEFLQREVETVVSEVKKAPEALEGPTAQAPEKPVDSVAVEVQKAAESVTAKVEKAAEAVGSKVEAVVGQTGGKESAGASEAQLPLTGPNSAKRLKEAQVRTPNASEKLSGSPDDVNPSDAPFQRMDSSKMPDLPYLFPKEDYGTPWVPPADFSKDKIQPFFGPWDNGPAPEKTITRPFRELEFDETYFPLGMGLTSIATAVGLWIWNIGKPAVNWDLLEDPTGVVQKMKAEKEAFDAEEAQRVANGGGEESSQKVEEKSH
jgi:chemotaxis protein histidine kinase CheA